MISLLSLACGVMFASGIYLLFQTQLFKFLIGVTLLGHAVNLALFVTSNPTIGTPSIIGANSSFLESGALDPVPQALILTAIVISFGTTALLAVLIRTTAIQNGLHNLDTSYKEDL